MLYQWTYARYKPVDTTILDLQ